MAYKRKTKDEFQIQGNYGCGFECVTVEETWREAIATVKLYREEEPMYQHRLKIVRVPIEQGVSA